MIGNGFSPFSPIFLILPFKDLFDSKISGVLGLIETDHPETSTPNIGDNLPLFQWFIFPNFSDNTVKMDRFAGIFIRQGGGHIFDRFTAIGTIHGQDRFGRHLGRRPLEALTDNSPVCVIPGSVSLFFALF
jgi:hypothetical protein